MQEFLEATIDGIDKRLAELGSERERLEAARLALTGESKAAAPTSRVTRGRSQPAPGRARPKRQTSGNRSDQALAAIRQSPGITAPELAEKLKVKPNYLYRVLASLAAENLITKDGRRLSAVEER